MSPQTETHFSIKSRIELPDDVDEAIGIVTGPSFVWDKVVYAGDLDDMPEDFHKRLKAEVDAWRSRQQLAEEWRAAAEASGALDLLRDDPLLEDGETEA